MTKSCYIGPIDHAGWALRRSSGSAKKKNPVRVGSLAFTENVTKTAVKIDPTCGDA